MDNNFTDATISIFQKAASEAGVIPVRRLKLRTLIFFFGSGCMWYFFVVFFCVAGFGLPEHVVFWNYYFCQDGRMERG
jgi:hypothetical protein